MTPMFFNGFDRYPVPIVGSGSAFPTNNSMFMASGNYVWDGQAYDCNAHGRYLFPRSDGTIEQRCVINGASGLMACRIMDWCHVHGAAHDPVTQNSLSQTGRSQKLRLTCGYLTNFATWLFPQAGIPARRRDVETLEPHNGWSDGHICVEIQVNGVWKMVDLTTGYYFTDTSGEMLSVEDFIEAIKGDFPTMNRLSMAYKTGSETFNGISYDLHRDLRLFDQVELQAWYRRAYQNITA